MAEILTETRFLISGFQSNHEVDKFLRAGVVALTMVSDRFKTEAYKRNEKYSLSVPLRRDTENRYLCAPVHSLTSLPDMRSDLIWIWLPRSATN
mmetsp:Transcript_16000/g.65809  ORF Transcript_16000/g.65809 Transcript_16000/m.65809 type:complete len:94 (-) Transcript_16000:3642-3923(-)